MTEPRFQVNHVQRLCPMERATPFKVILSRHNIHVLQANPLRFHSNHHQRRRMRNVLSQMQYPLKHQRHLTQNVPLLCTNHKSPTSSHTEYSLIKAQGYKEPSGVQPATPTMARCRHQPRNPWFLCAVKAHLTSDQRYYYGFYRAHLIPYRIRG